MATALPGWPTTVIYRSGRYCRHISLFIAVAVAVAVAVAAVAAVQVAKEGAVPGWISF
jgi:hypothetical protein